MIPLTLTLVEANIFYRDKHQNGGCVMGFDKGERNGRCGHRGHSGMITLFYLCVRSLCPTGMHIYQN